MHYALPATEASQIHQARAEVDSNRITSVFALLLAFAIFDTCVKNTSGQFPVNLVVFFYVSVYGFILFAIHNYRKQAANKFDRKILLFAAIPFVIRIALNLISIGSNYATYDSIVSNAYIDYMTWLILFIMTSITLWQKYTASRH